MKKNNKENLERRGKYIVMGCKLDIYWINSFEDCEHFLGWYFKIKYQLHSEVSINSGEAEWATKDIKEIRIE